MPELNKPPKRVSISAYGDWGKRIMPDPVVYAVAGKDGIFAVNRKEWTVISDDGDDQKQTIFTLYSGDDGSWKELYKCDSHWIPQIIAILQAEYEEFIGGK